MIEQSFQHVRGIGPKTDAKLKNLGLCCWSDCARQPDKIPFLPEKKRNFLRYLEESRRALNSENLEFFISNLPTREHWRILADYYSEATFFDIETTGLSYYDSKTTVISAFHRNEVHNFVYGENLDSFLELVDTAKLLVSFNGNSFDIPFLARSFNIPDISCPHIDLRWILYHQGFSGGLKQIERKMGIKRPVDIADVDGYEAVILFYRWQSGDRSARTKLINYCVADVISLVLVSGYMLEKMGIAVSGLKKIEERFQDIQGANSEV